MEQIIAIDLATWLIESYSRLLGKLDPWENQELYTALPKGSDTFYHALKDIFGTKLPLAILDASERTVEICKNYDMPLTSTSTENEIWANNSLIVNVNQIAAELLEIAQKYIPGIEEQCKNNAVLCNEYAEEAQKAMSRLMTRFHKYLP